jgi:hypothetical protein
MVVEKVLGKGEGLIHGIKSPQCGFSTRMKGVLFNVAAGLKPARDSYSATTGRAHLKGENDVLQSHRPLQVNGPDID